jgi:hypothetical protein
VISSHLVGGKHEVRIYSDTSPDQGFAATEAGLEDVYFLNLSNADKKQEN